MNKLNKLKQKLLHKLLNALSAITPKKYVLEVHEENIRLNILKAYKYTENEKMLARFIAESIFDARYCDACEESVRPSEILNVFYEKAAIGDKSFMSDPFFRLLRHSGDIEARKLRYRLKRNE
ncbi:MAG: hypothetical protein ACJA2M_000344 [Polaribacter sp.]|jgi:hypothetical protein